MKKTFKRFLSMLLVSCMAFSMVAGAEGAPYALSSYEEESMIAIISGMAASGTRYRLENAGPSTLTYSEPMNFYRIEDGVFQQDNAKLFAIFSGNTVVAIVTGSYENNELVSMQGTATGVDTLNEFLTSHDKIALIYSDKSVYYYSGEDLVHAWSYLDGTTSQPEEGIDFQLSDVEFTNMAKNQFDTSNLSKLDFSTRADDIEIKGYPAKTQQRELSCWAACTASILQYYKKGTYSESQIYGAVNITYDDYNGGNVSTAIGAIQELGYSVDCYAKPYGNFKFSEIKDRIAQQIPVFLGMRYEGGNTGHAIVCMGYSDVLEGATVAGSIDIMDPYNGSFHIVVVNKVPNERGKYFRYLSYGATWLELHNYSHMRIL